MLSELEEQGVIKRLAKGIYCKPRMTKNVANFAHNLLGAS